MIPDGFPKERYIVVSRPQLQYAENLPLTSRLLVTDCGIFPQARGHGRFRPQGCEETIVVLCSEGSGWVETGGKHYPIKRGQGFIIPAGYPHRYGADKNHPWSIWWLHITGLDLPLAFRSLYEIEPGSPFAVPQLERATALISEVVAALSRRESLESLGAASGAAWHLLALLVAGEATYKPEPSVINQALEHMQKNISQNSSVKELASFVGLSPSYFSALFKETTGVSVVKYRTRLRMSYARYLLESSAKPIGEIGRDVGYDDPLYFSKQFRKYSGNAPSSYRKIVSG